MSAYLQMGHDSENLVGQGQLDFAGVILSPVNRSESELAANLPKFRSAGNFDIVFDPQLYCPQIERGKLPEHSYFPSDFETADLSSQDWYRGIVRKLVAEGVSLGVDAICSPAILPKKASADYYARSRDIYLMLEQESRDSSIRPIMTICVALRDLADPNDSLRIASNITACNPAECYIVIEAETEPRRELYEEMNLFSLMVLVAALEKADCKAIVSHCSSDMILMKAAGASHCASGKFFNLRRFTRSRFDDPKDKGGKLLAYWFEQNLIGFLREADIARLRREGLSAFIGGGASNNFFGNQIMQQFINDPGEAWVALSWRQYLSWFIQTEAALSGTDSIGTVSSWLRDAEQRWEQIEQNEILLDENRNNGQWIRPWRQALSQFRRFEW